MSRTKAKQCINVKEYKNIYTTSINKDTLDEAVMAYKSLEDIIDVIKASVDIIEIMKPIYNFKASLNELLWKKKTDKNEDKRIK